MILPKINSQEIFSAQKPSLVTKLTRLNKQSSAKKSWFSGKKTYKTLTQPNNSGSNMNWPVTTSKTKTTNNAKDFLKNWWKQSLMITWEKGSDTWQGISEKALRTKLFLRLKMSHNLKEGLKNVFLLHKKWTRFNWIHLMTMRTVKNLQKGTFSRWLTIIMRFHA